MEKVVTWAVVGGFLVFFLLWLHQGYEPPDHSNPGGGRQPVAGGNAGRIFWLLFVANAIGIVYMGGFLNVVRTLP